MPSLLTCNSRRRSLWRSPTVGSNGTARRVGWCTSANYLRQAVSRSSFRPRSAVRRCWSDSRTISRNSSSRRHVAAGVRPDQPARVTPILQRHPGTSRRTLRGGDAPQHAVTSLASATTARTNTTHNRPADRRTLRGAATANAQTAGSPPHGSSRLTSPSRRDRDSSRAAVWRVSAETLALG